MTLITSLILCSYRLPIIRTCISIVSVLFSTSETRRPLFLSLLKFVVYRSADPKRRACGSCQGYHPRKMRQTCTAATAAHIYAGSTLTGQALSIKRKITIQKPNQQTTQTIQNPRQTPQFPLRAVRGALPKEEKLDVVGRTRAES